MGADIVDLSLRRIEDREPDITAVVRIYLDGGTIHEFCEVDARRRISSDLAKVMILSAFQNVKREWSRPGGRKKKRSKVTARAQHRR